MRTQCSSFKFLFASVWPVVAIVGTSYLGSSTIEQPKRSSQIRYINPQVPKIKLPSYQGQSYEATVPDTLDLAERSALAVNALTEPTDANADYELYWWAYFKNNPPWMKHTHDDHVQLKFYEALPLMRLASGSKQNRHVEQRLMEVLIQMQGTDDLLYHPLTGRPWAEDPGVDQGLGAMPKGDQYSQPWTSSRALQTLSLYHILTGDQRWIKMGKRIVDGLAKQAVYREDYAFFAKGMYAVNEVPDSNAPLPDKWNSSTTGWICSSLSKFYSTTGYEPARVLAEKLARFIRYHGKLLDSEGRFIGENAWGGPPHFHIHTVQLLGLLEYARAVGDWEMMQFVRKSFEFAKTKMDSTLLGYTPEFIDDPRAPNFSPELADLLKGANTSESCGLSDIIELAIKLTMAGVGDYWDDVDRWSRNHFAESQLTDVAWVDDMIKSMPVTKNGKYPLREPFPLNGLDNTTDNVTQKCIGSFGGWVAASDWQGKDWCSIMHCCTGNATRVIYYIWKNTLTYHKGQLKVNLLLNRASAWADVQSYIPYEGRVDVKVKKKCNLSIRIPEWVTRKQTRCKVNGLICSPSWDGRYASVGKVVSEDIVTVTFPIFEKTHKIDIQGTEYTIVTKGNDVVNIEPQGKYCPLYQRDKYRSNKVQWKKTQRFVRENELDW